MLQRGFFAEFLVWLVLATINKLSERRLSYVTEETTCVKDKNYVVLCMNKCLLQSIESSILLCYNIIYYCEYEY